MEKSDVKRIADVEANKAVKGHEKTMHKGAMKMAKGGVTSLNMKQMGRNLARAANQRKTGRGG
jgi:hypothetical protein